MTKKEWRGYAAETKKSIDFYALSVDICKKIMSLGEYEKSSCVMLYNALPDEISVDMLCTDCKKTFCFPAITANDIVPRKNSNKKISGKFGITEPTGCIIPKSRIDSAVIPGIMFDMNFNRLGRGKGVYDRFLADFSGIKIGVCPDKLLADSVCSELHDIKMDIIVTEKRILYKTQRLNDYGIK